MFASKKVRVILFVALLLLISFSIYLFNQAPEAKFNQQGGTSYKSYEKAKVLQVISEDLQEDERGSDLYTGSQELEVKILSGEHKGEVHTITNYVSLYLNVVAQKGQTIIVNIDTSSTKDYSVFMFNDYRAPLLLTLLLLFFTALWWIGGKKGLASVMGIIFTFACVVFLFIPMLYRGYSPILASILIVVLTTCVTLLFLNGWSSKSAAAILGTLVGVAIAGVIAYVFGNLAHISGYNIEEGESLIVIANDTGLQLKGLVFAGILLAALGAIMDVGISIAAAVHEVYLANPSLSKKDLYYAGLNVGRDMMGTMANTLILAFTGSSLSSLIIIYALKVPFNQLVNMNLIAIEVIQGMSGSLGIVLTVPIVAYISSRIIPKFEQKATLKK